MRTEKNPILLDPRLRLGNFAPSRVQSLANKAKEKKMSDMNLMNLAGSVLGGVAQGAGSVWEGYLNQQTQRETNAMQVDLANTAVQRRQKDLAAAGINPLMAGRIGGAETPTLQAPKMTGIAEAAGAVGRIPKEYQAMQQTSQQIELLKAQKEATDAETQLKTVTANWIPPQARSAMDLQKAQTHGTYETAAKTAEETATIKATRDPMVQKVLQEIGSMKQQQLTEEQRTKFQTEAARNAEKYFKGQASQAATVADQMAQYLEKYFNRENSIKLNKEDIATQLLRNENTLKIIDLVLRNKYGDAQEYTKIFNTPWQLPAAFSKGLESTYKGDQRVLPEDMRQRNRNAFELGR